MQGVIFLVIIAWVINSPWALALVGVLALTVISFFAWRFAREVIEAQRAPEPMGPPYDLAERNALRRQIADLEGAVRALYAEADTLRRNNAALRRDLDDARSAMRVTPGNPLYRRVGLDEDAPTWVIDAVRRAYRAKLHPDRYSHRLKAEAERRFKDAEEVFDRIEATRGSE